MKKLVMTIALVLLALPILAADEAAQSAPYFTSLDSAVAAAGEREYFVLDFYTDW